MAKQVDMISVSDRTVKEVGYNEKTKTLYIVYRKNNTKQTFTDIKLKDVERLLISNDMAKILNTF
ncbi:MAG: hypothetical protein M0R03_22560 [Novosphingobium sp.]|nr:hypothetical protein [Novosphingobium sp.]